MSCQDLQTVKCIRTRNVTTWRTGSTGEENKTATGEDNKPGNKPENKTVKKTGEKRHKNRPLSFIYLLTLWIQLIIIIAVLSDPGVAQLVERVVWDHEAAGSNPVTRMS